MERHLVLESGQVVRNVDLGGHIYYGVDHVRWDMDLSDD